MTEQSTDEPRRRTGIGPGRVLVAVYGIFAVSAGARAGVQIATKFGDAELAFVLSAVAAAIYLLATIALNGKGETARRLAYLACSLELIGVFSVGIWSNSDPGAFPLASVWSDFGQGYGFVPAVLPILGLLWLRHTRAGGRRSEPDTSG